MQLAITVAHFSVCLWRFYPTKGKKARGMPISQLPRDIGQRGEPTTYSYSGDMVGPHSMDYRTERPKSTGTNSKPKFPTENDNHNCNAATTN